MDPLAATCVGSIFYWCETSFEQTAEHSLSKVKDIHSVKKNGTGNQKWAPRISSKELVDFLFEQPYCKIRFLVSRNMAKARTASKYSCQLHERGFLDVPSIGCKKRLSTHNCGMSWLDNVKKTRWKNDCFHSFIVPFSTFPYSLGLSSWYRGKVTTIFVPKCSRLVRAIVPWCCSMICLTMERPKPVPPMRLLRLSSTR